MHDIYKDLEKTYDIITNHITSTHYDKIYSQSNEMLNDLFSNFSLKDKDVLSVLASSDQMFHCYNRGARSVDTFDINKLTYYYYYLRKWGILYFDEYYPNMRDLIFSNKYIYECMKKASLFSEEDHDAFLFWNEYCDRTWGYQSKELFYISECGMDNEIKDLSNLKDILGNNKLSFINIDISKEIDINKKYDIIILSNILEYLAFEDISFDILSNNLDKLLKEDGVVVCSHVMHRVSYEKHKLRDKFDFYEYPPGIRKTFIPNFNTPVGYCYKKKKNNLSTKKC